MKERRDLEPVSFNNEALWKRSAWKNSMVDLHETNKPKPQIDAVGWLFLAFAVVVTAAAAMIAYEANETMVARPVSQIAAR